MVPTRPAQAVKVDCGVLSEGALRATCRQRSLRHAFLAVSLHVGLGIVYRAAVLRRLASHIGARGRLGKVSAGSVKVHHLAAAT
jgi:hypothetical protein